MLLSSLAGFSSLLTDTCLRIGIWFKFFLPLRFPWSAHVANDLIVPDRRRCKVLFAHKLLLKFKYLDFKLSELRRKWKSLNDPRRPRPCLQTKNFGVSRQRYQGPLNVSAERQLSVKSWGQTRFLRSMGKKIHIMRAVVFFFSAKVVHDVLLSAISGPAAAWQRASPNSLISPGKCRDCSWRSSRLQPQSRAGTGKCTAW